MDINDVWKGDDEDKWKLGIDLYWKSVDPKTKNLCCINSKKSQRYEIERKFDSNDIRDRVEKMDQKTWYDFIHDEYCLWKYTDGRRYNNVIKYYKYYKESNNLEELFLIKKKMFAMDKINIRECIANAIEIKGLGIAGASGLLAVLFPEYFGTIDQFVVKALLKIDDIDYMEIIEKMIKKKDTKEELSGHYARKHADILIQIMRDKAQELNAKFNTSEWTPRKIDMVLWAVRDSEQ
jgi:hypothetical protein